MEALYFPFLHFKTGQISGIWSLFSKIFLLSLPGITNTPDDRTEEIRPDHLDPDLLETLSNTFQEKISLSGPEALRFLVSEKNDAMPSISALFNGITGKKTGEKVNKDEQQKKEELHLAAMILARAEELDDIQETLSRELAVTDLARKNMLRELTGEGEEVGGALQKHVPGHLETRMRSWLRLIGDCRSVPGFWITAMPDAESLLEKIFPEAQRKPLPPEFDALKGHIGKRCQLFFMEVPLHAAWLSGISFSDNIRSLNILCLTEARTFMMDIEL